MTHLPSGWEITTLKVLCLPIKKSDPVDLGRESVRYIDIGSVDGSSHALMEVPRIAANGAPSRCRQIVQAGDTVFSTVRPYLEKTAYVDESLDGEFASTGFSVLRPGPRLHPKYLHYFSISRSMLDQVLPRQKGVSYPAVLDKEVRATEIPVPPIKEQGRIVALLEDHLSRLDAADKGLAMSLAKLETLREQTIIHALTAIAVPNRVDGALTDVGTADGDLPSLPVGWSWARLGDVAEVVGGVTKDAKKQGDPSFVEVPYLRVANVQRGHLNLDTVTHIRVDPAKAKALRLENGDVLLNEGGDRDKLARGWVWEGQVGGCIHQNHVFRARLHDPRLDPYFLSWTTNTFGGRWAERNGKQSVNLASISLRMIRQMPVIVPAPGHAGRVVASLHDALDSNDRLASSLKSAREHGAALRRSLLAAAFSGRLNGNSSGLSVAEEMIGA